MTDNHIDKQQEAIFAFLADPATHDGATVKRIETHAAAVFLVGRRAFKVKRAGRFPFLDYSTLEKRQAGVRSGIADQSAPRLGIYRRVLPITRATDGALALDGGGTPVEWAVEMRRFDENATFDHLAAAGKINLELADALGQAVVAAQSAWQRQTLRNDERVEPSLWIKTLGDYIEEHVAAFCEAPISFRLPKCRRSQP